MKEALVSLILNLQEAPGLDAETFALLLGRPQALGSWWCR